MSAFTATTVEAEPVFITHINPDLCRLEARINEAVAGFIRYEMRDGQICFTLTELTRDFRNYRFAEALIRNALHEAERRELKVLPFCPLIRHFISTHADFLPLVPVGQRRRFNLV